MGASDETQQPQTCVNNVRVPALSTPSRFRFRTPTSVFNTRTIHQQSRGHLDYAANLPGTSRCNARTTQFVSVMLQFDHTRVPLGRRHSHNACNGLVQTDRRANTNLTTRTITNTLRVGTSNAPQPSSLSHNLSYEMASIQASALLFTPALGSSQTCKQPPRTWRRLPATLYSYSNPLLSAALVPSPCTAVVSARLHLAAAL